MTDASTLSTGPHSDYYSVADMSTTYTATSLNATHIKLVSLNFKLLLSQSLVGFETTLATAEAVNHCLSTSLKPMLLVQTRLANKAKLQPHALPLAFGVLTDALNISIILPTNLVPQEMEAKLIELGRLAGESIESALEQTGTVSNHNKLSDNGESPVSLIRSEQMDIENGIPNTSSKVFAKKVNRFDRIAEMLAVRLNTKRKSGEIRVSVNTLDANKEVASREYTIPQSNIAPKSVTFHSDSENIDIYIIGNFSKNQCTIKAIEASAQSRVVFATSGDLGLKLRLLEGGHPVTVSIQRRTAGESDEGKGPQMVIKSLISLSPQWGADVGGLNDLHHVINAMHQLIPNTEAESTSIVT